VTLLADEELALQSELVRRRISAEHVHAEVMRRLGIGLESPKATTSCCLGKETIHKVSEGGPLAVAEMFSG